MIHHIPWLNPRPCYAGIAEFSVYVERPWRGHGAGRFALEGLVREVEKAGFWQLVSRLFVENVASRALLGSLGFREVGVYEKHAQLDGAWRDVIIVERFYQPICTQDEASVSCGLLSFPSQMCVLLGRTASLLITNEKMPCWVLVRATTSGYMKRLLVLSEQGSGTGSL